MTNELCKKKTGIKQPIKGCQINYKTVMVEAGEDPETGQNK